MTKPRDVIDGLDTNVIIRALLLPKQFQEKQNLNILRYLWQVIRFGWRLVRWAVAMLLLMLLLRHSTLPLGTQWAAVAFLARDSQFDYLGWEINALAVKVEQTLYGLHPYMSESDRSDFTRTYMVDLARAQQLEAEVNRIFVAPDISDPETASADLRAERDALRADLRARQPLVESILEGQVAAVLVDEGFGVGGQLLPPMSMHFSQVPNVLVTSPRDTIQMDIAINIDPLPVDEKAALEDRIDAEQDVSSLILPLGGIALYPAMILETTSLPYAVEIFAHEWLHHYLFFFPIGYQYEFAGETRIINETTASLFGKEVGRLVLERYYPDLAPPPPAPATPDPDPDSTPEPTATPTPEADPPAFSYGGAMHETRIVVDELLAEGRVEEAEAYMEERRELFVENGYVLRKLNQAFFAFYGGYQSGSPGVGGTDPIGPAVQSIRDNSPSIRDWIVTMQPITTREQLLAVAESLQAE